MKKTLIIILTVILMGSLILSGCSKKEGIHATEKPGVSDKNVIPQEKLTLNFLRPENPAMAVNPNSPALQYIEKIKGVKINLQSVPASDYGVKKKTLISTNRIPDVINVNINDLSDYASTGIFLDLTPYLEKMPNLKKAMSEYPELDKQLINGKRYGLPMLDRVPLNYAQMPMIRTDILKSLNLPMPTSFEELYQTLKKMKAANPDSYPWAMRNGIKAQLSYLGYAFGSGYTIYYEPNKNKYQYGPLYPEFKNILTYLKKLYDEKLLDPNYAVSTAQQWQENLSSGKSLFFYDNNKFTTNFNLALQQKNPNALFDMVPVLKNDSGQRRNYMYGKGHLDEFYAISSKVENPERVLQFFDWTYSEEGADITNYGVPGVHFNRTKDGIKIDEKLVEEFKTKSDPTRAIQSFLGTGYLAFNTYSDETFFFIMSPKIMTTWNDFIKKEFDEGLLQTPKLDPQFTPEEAEKLKQLRTKVGTIVEQNMDKFIMGGRSLGDYDKFVKELMDAGAEEIEKIYNEGNERYKSKK